MRSIKNMMLSSAKILSLLLLITFHLYYLQPVGEHDNEVGIKEFTKVQKKLKDGFQAPVVEDDKSEEILPLRMTHLTPALIEKAKRELNETDEIKQKALVELRRLIEAEENLVSPTDDVFLLAFLRKNNFDVAQAFKRVQDYWILKRDYQYIYANVDRERVLSLLEKNLVGALKYRDREGCTVIIAKLGMWDPNEDLIENVFLAVSGVLTYALEDEATQIAGYRVIVDLRGVGWRQMKFLTASNMIFALRALSNALPGSFRKLHVLGEAKMIRFGWTLIHPFMPKEVQERFSLHGEDFEFLQDLIHPTVLPEEYGGLGPHFAISMDRVRANFDKISKLVEYGYTK